MKSKDLPPIIKMELGNQNEFPPILKNNDFKNVDNFLHQNISGVDKKIVHEKVVAKAKEDVKSAYPPPPENKPIAQEPTAAIKKVKKNTFLNKVKDFFKNNTKKLLVPVAMIGAGMSAEAQDTRDVADQAFFNSNKNIARPVSVMPKEYKEIATEGNRTYGVKLNEGVKDSEDPKTLGTIRRTKDEKNYEKNLITELQSGKTSVERLIVSKSITPDRSDEFKKYEKPSGDIVYIESQKTQESDPFAAFAKDQQRVFLGNKAVLDMGFPTRVASTIQEGGALTFDQNSNVAMIFINDFGKTGERLIIDLKEKINDSSYPQYDLIQDLFVAGTTTLKSQDALNILKKKAKEFEIASKNKIYQLTPEDISKGSTVKN